MTTSQINLSQLRPSGDDGLGPIVQITPQRQAEAIERLVSSGLRPDRDHARRFLDYAQSHRVSLEHLWSRLDKHGRIESTVLAVPSPGRTAMVFASHPQGHEQIPSLAGLIDHAGRALRHADVNLAQVLLDQAESIEREAFLAGGFNDLAILSYLERPVRPSRSTRHPLAQWPPEATTVPYRESMRDELLAVLESSYEDTLDCPGLRGYRKTEDIFAGHRASGLFDPSLWTILYFKAEPIGALLLNPSSDHQTIELVYLGLAKSARGHGWGRQLLRHGLALVEGRPERAINLAVDENNAPAITLYKREGFRPSLRRRAMIRPL